MDLTGSPGSDDQTPVPGAAAGGGTLRTSLENAVVALFKEYYGRGPSAAKGWILDDYVIVVLEGGLGRNEETLVANGQEEEVRRFRLAFQESVRAQAVKAVADVVGREVIGYHSQIVFNPTRSFELFVLAPEQTAGAPAPG